MSLTLTQRSARWAVALAVAAAPAFTTIAAAPAAQAAAGATGEIVGIAGKCVDDAGGSTQNGTKIEVWDCNGTSAQSWYVGSDGTLHLGGPNGKCLETAGQGTTNGIGVDLSDCTGGSSQKWTPDANGRLVGTASGRCLDAPGGSATNGLQLDIYDCNLTAAQQWSLPDGLALAVSAPSGQNAVVGAATGLRPTGSGGTAPYAWSATGLPPGMAMNYINGTVQGAPTSPGTYTATLTATDLKGAIASTTFTWTVSAPSSGTAWYLDCSAATGGNGSQGSPWNTVASADAHTFAPGDSLLLKRGTTCTGQLAPRGSGTAAAPITLDAYGTGANPTVAGNGVAAAGSPALGGGAVQLTDQSYWIIQNLKVTNHAGAEARRSGIDILVDDKTEHDGITIRDTEVTDVTGFSDRGANYKDFYLSHGIGVDLPYDGGFVKGLTIADNYVHDLHGNGIGLYGDQDTGNNNNAVRNQQVLIQGNTLKDISNDGIVVCVSDSPLIDHNTADQLGWTAVNAVLIAGIWGWGDTNPTFQFNEVSNITLQSHDSEAWDCDGYITGTCTYQDNYDHDNAGGILLDCVGCGGAEATVIVYRHNVSVNDCRIINMSGNLASYRFSNNTIDCGTKTWDTSSPAPSYAEFDNNIFRGPSGSAVWVPSGPTYANNTFIGFAAAGYNASTADPQFVGPTGDAYGIATLGGYQLSAGSPALASGTVVPNWGQEIPANDGQDLWGNLNGTVPNRGAYSGAGTGAPTRIDDTAASYTGSWGNAGCAGCYGGANHYTNSTGAAASTTVTGSTISVFASQTSDNGIAAVSIDGGPAVNVNLYTPGSAVFGQLVFTSPRLTYGSHTVTITCTGQSDPRSSGTYVSLDSYTASS
ncbi:hypothetical protein ABIA31_006152 [Catenulispora sp. MAP5-51]|uniref:ricin-type beta-trefoil lectin domain protein n=1 Tax=Catenulispora sp. MAP5-51 TaxID=3156298 RepID=UPI003515E7BF